MPKVEILNVESHTDLRVNSGLSAKFEDANPVAVVSANELPQLALDFPVFIAKNPKTGEFELKAVMGFAADENLFIHDGSWRASYTPLDLQRKPFQACLIGVESISDIESDGDVKVGLNVESDQVSTTDGQRLFNDDGSHTDYLNGVTRVLGTIVEGLKATVGFLKAVSDAGLIEPVQLQIPLPGEKSMSFDGLYTIHHQRLSQLPNDTILEFHEKGYLQACYAMIHSVGHVEKLIGWKAHKEA